MYSKVQNRICSISNNYMSYFQIVQTNERQIYKQARNIDYENACMRNLTLSMWVKSKNPYYQIEMTV